MPALSCAANSLPWLRPWPRPLPATGGQLGRLPAGGAVAACLGGVLARIRDAAARHQRGRWAQARCARWRPPRTAARAWCAPRAPGTGPPCCARCACSTCAPAAPCSAVHDKLGLGRPSVHAAHAAGARVGVAAHCMPCACPAFPVQQCGEALWRSRWHAMSDNAPGRRRRAPFWVPRAARRRAECGRVGERARAPQGRSLRCAAAAWPPRRLPSSWPRSCARQRDPPRSAAPPRRARPAAARRGRPHPRRARPPRAAAPPRPGTRPRPRRPRAARCSPRRWRRAPCAL